MTKRFLMLALVAVVTSIPSLTWAQQYPVRAIKVIVPFPAGSGTDVIARRVGDKLQRILKQPLIIDNKPGANGIIAAQAAATAEPDGYTIFITSISTQATNVSLYKSLPYDAQKDFAPISGIVTNTLILTARPDLPANDVPALIKFAKASPQALTFGSGNTSSIVGNASFKLLTGVDVLDVPYKGTLQAVTDLMASRIDLYFVEGASALTMIRTGKIKALAVAGPKIATLPNVPTMQEAGLPGLRLVTWIAAFAPARTPKSIVDKLNAAIVQVVNDKDEVAYFESVGSHAFPTTPDELGRFERQETIYWADLIKKAGIEMQ